MKNVFIEGIQGSGKSTLFNRIFNAVPAFHVCREGDYSPIDLAWCTWMSKEEYETVLKRYKPIQNEIIKNTFQEQGHFVVTYTKIITDIPNFHKELETYAVYNGRMNFQDLQELIFSRYENFSETGYLFECSFFQNIVENLMLFHLLSDDEIVGFYRELFRSFNKKETLLLYLYSENLEENIRTIKKERCDNLGNEIWYELMLGFLTHSPLGRKHGYCTFEDMISHFKHRQQLEVRIINEIIGDKAILFPSKDWDISKVLEISRFFE